MSGITIRSLIKKNFSLGIARFYSSKPLLETSSRVGPKFQSIDDIKEYMDKPTWSLNEFFKTPNVTDTSSLPSEETVIKLLKLSGLSTENADIPGIQKRLGQQLLFLRRLHDAPLDEGENLDIRFSRILPRHTNRVDYKSLLKIIEQQENAKFPDEEGGKWDPTSQATHKGNGYFVVTKQNTSSTD